ncbi:Urmylation protein [Arachnomyces sp. PD_36]|nr:Urmylation protein [Arachnomyces sp. PD_36]
MKEIENLRQQIAATEDQLARLKKDLAALEEKSETAETTTKLHNGDNITKTGRKWPLSLEEYKRYGRQMIVPQMGIQGQLKLRSSSVLLVGAGGLGCPAAVYLAGAGVGTIGLVDGDTVEASNLHRQVLHRTENVGKYKVDSAIQYLQELNLHPKYIPYRSHLTPENAPDIFAGYDIILDCTDNPATRYLISDTAVLLGKPLVSASALRTEGQLMVLNNPPRPPGDSTGGPCYRCVFPNPPPADGVVSCADGGILGPVVGTMGVMQALEAIKVITAFPKPEESVVGMSTSSSSAAPTEPPYLHLFSAYSTPPFRAIRLRSRRKACISCSSESKISLDSLKCGSMDYVLFCGSASSPNVLSPEERISPLEYQKLHSGPEGTSVSKSPIMIDVREKVQFDICNLENSINIPISTILSSAHQPKNPATASGDSDTSTDVLPSWLPPEIASSTPDTPIYVVCRLGNDSQIAVQKMRQRGLDRGGQRSVRDIRGGFRAWKREVDPDWPEY